jgi:hypothetical protein
MPTEDSARIRVAVHSALKAHFSSAQRPKPAGRGLGCVARQCENAPKILVRTLDRDFPGIGDQQVAAYVVKFVSDRLIDGRLPAAADDGPPHLTMTAADVELPERQNDRKSWWRFW